MNDVLPKPFTKEGMLRSLEKHLQHFKRGYAGPPPAQRAQQQQQQQQAQQAQQAQAQAQAQQAGFYGQPQIGGSMAQPQSMAQTSNGMTQPIIQTTMSGPSGMVQTAMPGMRPIKDEASPLSKTSPASSWHSPQQIQGQSPNSTAPSLGGSSLGPGSAAGAGSMDPRFGSGPMSGPQMAQSGAAYSMTPGNPVPVYQQGAQAAVMMGRDAREMQQAVAVQQQQQQAEAQRQRHVEGMRQAEGMQQQRMQDGMNQGMKNEGHRRMMSDIMEGGQEAKRQRM